MPTNVFLDERRDEIVAVIVAFAQAQIERDAGRRARGLEQVGLELGGEERVVGALIDANRGAAPTAACDQRRRVVVAPRRMVVAQVPAERLFTPRAVHRRTDG